MTTNEIRQQYNRLTSQNNHTGAAALLVKHFGTKDEANLINDITERQNSLGYILTVDMIKRDGLTRKYHKIIKSESAN
jgi:hypothetical protein